jgi:hypothetical protein
MSAMARTFSTLLPPAAGRRGSVPSSRNDLIFTRLLPVLKKSILSLQGRSSRAWMMMVHRLWLEFKVETSEKLLVQYFLPEQASLESAVIAG